MNALETAHHLLGLCPIPSSIQQIIYYSLVGHGTTSANAIQTCFHEEEEIPIRVVIWGDNDDSSTKCRYTVFYMEKTKNRCYDNSSHYSLIALFDLHPIYLSKKSGSQYAILKTAELARRESVLTSLRLARLQEEESKIKN
jgi:hypothetical protein